MIEIGTHVSFRYGGRNMGGTVESYIFGVRGEEVIGYKIRRCTDHARYHVIAERVRETLNQPIRQGA